MTDPQPNSPPKYFLHPLWGLFAIVILGFPLFFLFAGQQEPPDTYGPAPSFQLSNQSGETVSKESILNKPTVVNFIFTRCQNVCPTLTARMVALQEQVPAEEALFLSFTVDPAYDSPAVLKQYADRFGVDHSRWHFLTGDQQNIQQTMRGFQQAYEIVTNEEEGPVILHSEKFILIDQKGDIRGFYDDNPEGTRELLQAIDYLL